MKRLASILAAVGTLLLTLSPLIVGTVAAAQPGNQHFTRTWQRTDDPVAQLLVNRTWMWGPEGKTDLMTEEYAESPGSERTVQYFDKSRMEITQPGGDSNSIWYVTNGLLVVELITGKMQIGDNLFETRQPATVPVAGDGGDENGPTYETFNGLLLADAKSVGDTYAERLSKSGQITVDPSLAAQAIRADHFDEVTRHTIAEPFWDFMNSSGTVYQNGQYVEALMFESPLFATGRPITEAYWAEVLIAGTPTDVLMQCFERRCLTYNPSNGEGWQVEAGNVGIHYYDWRYGATQDPEPGNPGSGNPPPGEPDPGNPPPDDPPPGDPDPGNDPPPSDPPPGDLPAGGDVPTAPHDLSVEGHVGGVDGPYAFLYFMFGESGGATPNEFEETRLSGLQGVGENQADQFDIYRQFDGGAFVRRAQLDPDEFHMWDYDVDSGHRYCYYIIAINEYGASSRSETVCVEIPYPPDTPRLISPPAGYISYDREITFEWETVAGATGYVLCVLQPADVVGAHCDFDLNPSIGHIVWISGATAASGTLTTELPESLTPDDELSDLYWSVSACIGSAYDCGTAPPYNQLLVELRADIEPPILIRSEVDPNDPGRFTFYWNLSEGAERYVLCVAEPGANCEYETGNYYKSSVLGPTVDTYPMDIPLWLAPDGQVTNLNWTVAACDADLNCVWQPNILSITVDRSNGQQLAAPTLANPADGAVTDISPTILSWNPVAGAASYRVCLAYDAGDSCPYNQTFWSSYLDSSTTTWTVYTPDGTLNELEWTVAACDASNTCVWQEQTRTVTIDLRPEAPELISAVVDGQQPYRFVFSWNLVTGGERYILCVAEPGANCEYETGNYYKSSVLGPTVDTYPMDIPLWLAPDGQVTNLNWTVATCDTNLNCVWQYNFLGIVVDRS